MKILRKKINDLQYWSYGTKAQKGIVYKRSVYNYMGIPEIEKIKLQYIGCIIYNVYTNALTVLNKKEYAFFKQQSQFSSDGGIVDELVEQGFLVPVDMEEKRYMLEETRSSLYLRNCWRQFTILPTQKCNARCFYCFENDVKRIRMNKETADQTVKFILQNLRDIKEFNLDWFGGEPLLEFNRITEMVEQINRKTSVPFTSSITTNATLFNKEKVKMAVEKWNLKRASITIDGLYDEHNKRKAVPGMDAFNITMDNIRHLLNNGVYVNLRIHMDMYNKDGLDDILSYLEEFSCVSNFHLFVEKLFIPLQVEKHVDINRYIKGNEVDKFYYQMMELMKKHGFVKSFADFFSSRRETACMGTRRDSILIDCDGYLYKCEQEFYNKKNNVGNVYSGICYNKHYLDMTVPKIEHTYCEECTFLPSCHGGCQFTKLLSCDKNSACMRGKILTRLAMRPFLLECDRKEFA